MDNLVNYGSDDENVDSDNSSKYRQGTRRMAPHGGYARPPSQQQQRGGGARTGDDGTNYDPVQMDLSEEDEPMKRSQSLEMNRDRVNRSKNRQRDGRDRGNTDRDRDKNNHRDSRDDNERDSRGGRDDRDRSSQRAGKDQQRTDRRDNRDNRDAGARKNNGNDRDSNNRRDSRDSSDNRRDRDNTTRRDRDNFNSRDNCNRQRDNRRRSPIHINSNNYRGGAAARRFDRASNKLAQLEKLGIEIKAPENFVPPASGIYTPDDARGNNGPYQGGLGENATGAGGDGQFFMPGVTGRFRDQIERRKQLWAKSKQQTDAPTPNHPAAPTVKHIPQPAVSNADPNLPGHSTWAATTFAQDTDGRQANKFKRLMGIRGGGDGDGDSAAGASGAAPTNKRQEEMFNSMEAQYEVARTATHTMRGVGLGFSSATQGLYQR